jgi:hypothetical protein
MHTRYNGIYRLKFNQLVLSKNIMDHSKHICSNCRRMISAHNEKEHLYCTKKIMEDLVLADENRRRMITEEKSKKS